MKIVLRFVVLAVVMALTFFLFEGFYSFFRGGSLRDVIAGRQAPPRIAFTDEEKIRAASLTKGPYALSLDPFIGLELKGSFEAVFHDVKSTTDAIGCRTRLGPAPEEGAPRIVILGDSVAYGYGVTDDQTLAQHLEAWLADTMAEGSPRPVVRTAACPGWTIDNSRRFLLDHLADLDPDIVLMIPVANDLDDTYTVGESGRRSDVTDPGDGAHDPFRSLEYGFLLANGMRSLRRTSRSFDRYGASGSYYVLYTGLTPESRRRYDHAVSALEDLAARVESRGGKFATFLIDQSTFTQRFIHARHFRKSTLRLEGIFSKLSDEDRLEDDPHYNGRTNRGAAWRMARFLLEQGWVPGAGAKPLPPESERFADKSYPIPTGEKLEEEIRLWKQHFGESLFPLIDMRDGRGAHQVYGGVGANGGVGIAFHACLRAPGATRIELTVAPHAGVEGLYPLDVAISINGVEAKTLTISSATPAEQRFTVDIPESARGEDLEVLGRSSNWTRIKEFRISGLRSFTLVTLEAK